MKFLRYFKNRKIYRLGIAIFGLLFVVIAIVTFYGQNSGNFVINLDKDAYLRGIVLSKDHEFKTQSSRVVATAVNDVTNITYDWFEDKIPDIVENDGDYFDSDYKYLAFTFYLKNSGEETVNVNLKLDVTESLKGTDEAIRILLIEDGTQKFLYQKKDNVDVTYLGYLSEAINFNTDTNVCNKTVKQFRPGDVKKYTLIMWLEGEDPDCTIDILGGKLKMQMIFSIDNFDNKKE